MLNDTDHDWLPKDEKKSRYSYGDGNDRIYTTRKKCEWLWRSAVINWDGTVTPCCVFESPGAEVGSLDGKKFAEVWNNENYRMAREVFTREGTAGTAVICGRCRGVPKAFDKDQHGLY
jgi:radical SAM protein with 4Fe4S-binding SPASM domain